LEGLQGASLLECLT